MENNVVSINQGRALPHDQAISLIAAPILAVWIPQVFSSGFVERDLAAAIDTSLSVARALYATQVAASHKGSAS